MLEKSIPPAEVYATAICEYVQAIHPQSFFTRTARHSPEQLGEPISETSICLFRKHYGIFSEYVGLIRIIQNQKTQKKSLSIRIAKEFLSKQELTEIAREIRATDYPTI